MRPSRPLLALLGGCFIAAAAASDDWPSYGLDAGNQRFSTLADIETGNVGRLAPAWIFQTGVLGTFPTNPLVVNGVMYLTMPMNHVIALDAATGRQLWRYTHRMAA